MNPKLHNRLEELLLEELNGEISPTDYERLQEHLDGCTACQARSQALQTMLQGLKTYQVQVNPELIRSTQQAIHHRAQELEGSRSRNVILWCAAAASWIWILWSAPWLWWILHWLGEYIGLPGWVWQMAFGFWWLLPALATAVILGIYREERSLATEWGPNARLFPD